MNGLVYHIRGDCEAYVRTEEHVLRELTVKNLAPGIVGLQIEDSPFRASKSPVLIAIVSILEQ